MCLIFDKYFNNLQFNFDDKCVIILLDIITYLLFSSLKKWEILDVSLKSWVCLKCFQNTKVDKIFKCP